MPSNITKAPVFPNLTNTNAPTKQAPVKTIAPGVKVPELKAGYKKPDVNAVAQKVKQGRSDGFEPAKKHTDLNPFHLLKKGMKAERDFVQKASGPVNHAVKEAIVALGGDPEKVKKELDLATQFKRVGNLFSHEKQIELIKKIK